MYKEYGERDLRIQALNYLVSNITRRDPSASIIFSDHDLDSIKMPHLNPLVIKLRISNAIVSRVLVDGGSSSDTIFWQAFKQMGIDQSLIIPRTAPVAAFNGALVYPVGTITLLVHVADRVVHVDFLIIDTP